MISPSISAIAIPLHVAEILLAIIIGYLAISFFHITKPTSVFLYFYAAMGFLITNSFMYLMLYTRLLYTDAPDQLLANVYLGGRIAIIGMLVSLALFFMKWNSMMRGHHSITNTIANKVKKLFK